METVHFADILFTAIALAIILGILYLVKRGKDKKPKTSE